MGGTEWATHTRRDKTLKDAAIYPELCLCHLKLTCDRQPGVGSYGRISPARTHLALKLCRVEQSCVGHLVIVIVQTMLI